MPPLPLDRKVFIGLFVMLGIGVALFPLTGLSLPVMITLDQLWQWSTNAPCPAPVI